MRIPPSSVALVNKQGTSKKLVLYPQPQPHPMECEKGLMAGTNFKIIKFDQTLHLTTGNITNMPQLLLPSTTPAQSPTNGQQPVVDPKHHPLASTQIPEASEILIHIPAIRPLHPPRQK
jgi:hypothetical protein